jgi:hypothetical protein
MPSSTIRTSRAPRSRAAAAPVVIAIPLALLALLSAPARAADVTLAPTADTFVSASESAGNYGGAGAIEVSAPGSLNGEFQGLLRFNAAAAKTTFDAAFGAGNWRLSGAALRLTASSPNNPLFNANVGGPVAATWMQNDAWLEGTGGPNTPTTDGVTYATLPSVLGPADESVGTLNFAGGNSGAATYALTLTPAFAADLAAGNDVSLRLAAATGSTTSYLFSSRTFATAANRPTLTLTAVAVPEPAAGAVLLLGAFATTLARRGRRVGPR